MLKILKVLLGILLISILYFYGRIDPKLIDLSYSSIITYLFVIVLISATIFLAALRLYIILNILSLKIQFNYVFKLTYIGNFFNQCLPGATGGDLIKIIYLIKRYKFFNKATLISYIIIDRLFGFLALFILFLFSLYILSDFNENLLILFYFFIIFSLIILILIFIFIYFDVLKFLIDKMKNYKNYFAYFFTEYFKDLRNFINFKLIDICKLLILSTTIWMIAVFAILLLRGESFFNINSSIIMFFTSSITFFANSIPISFNGLGIGEYVFSQLATIFYDDKAVVFGNIFLVYRISVIFSSLPGLIIFVTLKNKLK